MKTLNIAAFALNAALYTAFGVLVYSILPLNFEGVRFWPQVIIPAVFAVIFGPWVGGLGAALGILLNDVILGFNPLGSLIVGVPSNFLAFWLLGYISNKKINFKNSTIIYGVVTAVCAIVAYVYTNLLGVGIVISCYIVYLVVVLLKSKWLSYEVGSVVGLLVGSSIIGCIYPIFLVVFAPSLAYIAPLTAAGVLALFIWTFSSEIPFLLILGPPIIEAINRAFPMLSKKQSEKQ